VERLYACARSRAQAAGVAFTITRADIRAVYPADGRCPALGVVMQQGVGRSTDRSPTLDRMNPMWGYEKSNIAVISLAANRAKGGMTAHDLEKIVHWMRARGLA